MNQLISCIGSERTNVEQRIFKRSLESNQNLKEFDSEGNPEAGSLRLWKPDQNS